MTRPLPGAALLAASLLLSPGCADDAPPGAEPQAAAAPSPSAPVGYRREYLFLAGREGTPTAAPFSFVALDRGDALVRTVQGWLARGGVWDGVLEERWRTDRATGVWKLLPHRDLRLAAGGPTEIQALWYRDDERRIRLELTQPVSAWERAGEARFRVLRGGLRLDGEAIAGTVLETLEVERAGRRAPRREWLMLALGDSLRMVIHSRGPTDATSTRGSAWSLGPQGERVWGRAEVQWTAVRPLERARREVPTEWRFQIPEAGIFGELRSLGHAAQLGPADPAGRAVQVRYTVEGWVEVDGHRNRVVGAARFAHD